MLTFTGHFLVWIWWMPMPFYLNRMLSDLFLFFLLWVYHVCTWRCSLFCLYPILQPQRKFLIIAGFSVVSQLVVLWNDQDATNRHQTGGDQFAQLSWIVEYISKDESVTLTNRGSNSTGISCPLVQHSPFLMDMWRLCGGVWRWNFTNLQLLTFSLDTVFNCELILGELCIPFM